MILVLYLKENYRYEICRCISFNINVVRLQRKKNRRQGNAESCTNCYQTNAKFIEIGQFRTVEKV